MSYSQEPLDEEQRRAKRHRLLSQQISFDSDMKKNHRAQELIQENIRETKGDILRLQSVLDGAQKELKKLQDKEIFFSQELHRLKKELREL